MTMRLQCPVPSGTIITQKFGENPGSYQYICRADKSHNGVDYGVGLGTPIQAAADGKVEKAGQDKTGYGIFVKLVHADGSSTIYAHLQEAKVREGYQVKAGQTIGLSGSTGNSTGPHLHFEYRLKSADCRSAVDPLPYMDAAQKPAAPAGEEKLTLSGQARALRPVRVRSAPDALDSGNVVGYLPTGIVVAVVGYVNAGGDIWFQLGASLWAAGCYQGEQLLELVSK